MTREQLVWAISEMDDDDRIAIGKHDAEQRAEIARLREALVEIVEKCEYEDWEYMFGDILIKAQQALKETTI